MYLLKAILAFNFNQFIRIHDGKNTFKFTLSQEFGYANPEWVRVNAYHPLVVAALNFFKQSCDASSTTFALKIKSSYVAKYPALAAYVTNVTGRPSYTNTAPPPRK